MGIAGRHVEGFTDERVLHLRDGRSIGLTHLLHVVLCVRQHTRRGEQKDDREAEEHDVDRGRAALEESDNAEGRRADGHDEDDEGHPFRARIHALDDAELLRRRGELAVQCRLLLKRRLLRLELLDRCFGSRREVLGVAPLLFLFRGTQLLLGLAAVGRELRTALRDLLEKRVRERLSLHSTADLVPALQLHDDVRHTAEDPLAGEAALRHRDLLEDAVHVREEDVTAPVQHQRGQEHGPIADAETPDLHHVLLFDIQFLRRQVRGHG